MIYNQYLQGDLSLIITEADFSKRARYTCKCRNRDICDVNLQVEAVNTPLQIVSGQPLLLDLDTPEPVAIRYNRTDSDSDQICTVDGRSTQCQPEYTNRASVISVLKLRGTKPSDSGVYDVWDIRNAEVIRTYTVDVQDGGDGSEALGQEYKLSRSRRSAVSYCQPCVCSSQTAEVPGWVVPVLAVMGTALLVAVLVIMLLVRRSLQLHKEPERNRDGYHPSNEHQGNGANGANNSTQQSTELSSLTSPQKSA
ncbi:uncharacterized protein LOC111188516 isoform X1 [Astyanax mexicanus]|uniref:uncharacterized protein LOC111188516 isoform X1 n=1 Tax=Astyanax mexicanus TaxID=7994 RepID=UPI0020CB58C4|nr:uncharacterized protein LOC111188516 isoform X1 [Astyanax mexicanus]